MFDVAVPRTIVNPPLVDLFLNPLLGVRRVSLHGGANIFEPAGPATSLYFIHRGQVRLYQVGPDGTMQLLDILGPNEWFGIDALAGAANHVGRAITVGASIISEVPVDRFFALLQQQPRAVTELIRSLATRLRNAREESGRLIFDDCLGRLLKTLLRFSHSPAATPSGNSVCLRITHLQLAQAVGVARETVSLTLKDLRDQNVIRTGRNQITFDPPAVEQFLQQRLLKTAPQV